VPPWAPTVNELTIISLKTKPGDRVTKGQKIASSRATNRFSTTRRRLIGTIVALPVKPGEVLQTGVLFMRLETDDASLKHLESNNGAIAPAPYPAQPSPRLGTVWTPRATKLAQEAGLDVATLTGIEATGPGGRVSVTNVTQYLAKIGKK